MKRIIAVIGLVLAIGMIAAVMAASALACQPGSPGVTAPANSHADNHPPSGLCLPNNRGTNTAAQGSSPAVGYSCFN